MTVDALAVSKIRNRQKARLIGLFIILVTFPITMNYISVFLIIQGASEGVFNFPVIFWSLFTLTALAFGRAACGYICPLGAIQETKDRMVPKPLTRKRIPKIIKYVLAGSWVGTIIYFVISAGGYKTINLLYYVESGVSVDSAQGWITWAMIVLIVLVPALILGKRGFCHFICPWGVLNIIATKVKNRFLWPSLHLRVYKNKCKQCRTCLANCPMSLPVAEMVQTGSMKNEECILCGTCVDNCPNRVLSYSWSRPE